MLRNLMYQEKANQYKRQFFSGLVGLESFQYADLNEILFPNEHKIRLEFSFVERKLLNTRWGLSFPSSNSNWWTQDLGLFSPSSAN